MDLKISHECERVTCDIFVRVPSWLCFRSYIGADLATKY